MSPMSWRPADAKATVALLDAIDADIARRSAAVETIPP
jgi:hypothetical protein